ncbi:heterogeneous nuclear ribonucleoprotein A3 [Archaeoglobus veneficus SNP6]|uniref:Heterogeneous nuclear ribonucleoprotein A3 n=2 Tax=Archaeoglobus veneficus TaxID=58290 RepID=F2KSI3_ARCVS|nr:heterogeneous nuclear ribonucleoprotein A3 [Archaeoglobus veneficus SNP6]
MKEKHGVERPFEHLTGSAGSSQPEPFTVKPPELSQPADKPAKVPVAGEKKKEERRERRMEGEEARYECGNCGFKFSKKYKHCPNCGARFDWSAVEEE